MTRYRTDAAKAMSGGLIFIILVTRAVEGVVGAELPKDTLALVMLLGASALAAWLAEPRSQNP